MVSKCVHNLADLLHGNQAEQRSYAEKDTFKICTEMRRMEIKHERQTRSSSILSAGLVYIEQVLLINWINLVKIFMLQYNIECIECAVVLYGIK